MRTKDIIPARCQSLVWEKSKEIQQPPAAFLSVHQREINFWKWLYLFRFEIIWKISNIPNFFNKINYQKPSDPVVINISMPQQNIKIWRPNLTVIFKRFRLAFNEKFYITCSWTTDVVFGGMILKWSRRVPGPIKAVTAAVTFETISSPFLVLLTLSGNGYEVTCTVKNVE